MKFHCSFHDSKNLYFLLELAPRGSLANFLRREPFVTLKKAQAITAEIVAALEYLRSEQIAHRDLKPGNILFDENYHIKLCDFATAKVFNQNLAAKIPKKTPVDINNAEEDRINSFVGTEEYVSPEVITDKASGYEADLWSLGVILY